MICSLMPVNQVVVDALTIAKPGTEGAAVHPAKHAPRQAPTHNPGTARHDERMTDVELRGFVLPASRLDLPGRIPAADCAQYPLLEAEGLREAAGRTEGSPTTPSRQS